MRLTALLLLGIFLLAPAVLAQDVAQDAAQVEAPAIELPEIEFTVEEKLKVLLGRWTVAVEQAQKWQDAAVTLSQQVNALLPAQSKSITQLLTEMGFSVGTKGDNPEGEEE